jgi:hypothetical protein
VVLSGTKGNAASLSGRAVYKPLPWWVEAFEKFVVIHSSQPRLDLLKAYTSPGVKSAHRRTPPMNKTFEIVLTALALAGMYCAIPKGIAPAGNPVIQTQQPILLADGSDPMPFCRSRLQCSK